MNSYETIIAIVVMIIIGYICRRMEFLRPEDAPTLNKIVLYIAIPSLILLAMYQADLSNLNILGTMTLICLIIGFLCGGLAYLYARINKLSARKTWSLVTTSAMFNSGFLGYPVCLGVFGVLGLIRAVFFDIGNTMLFIIFGVILMFIYGGSYQAILKRSVLFPPFIAFIVGILLNLLHIPLGVIAPNILEYLSGAAIPLIMISLGLSLEFKEVYQHLSAASFVTITRLIISPLIAVVMAMALGFTGLDFKVTVVEAGMPSAMLTLVLAITYDLDVKLTAACIFLSTALSMLTLTLLILFI